MSPYKIGLTGGLASGKSTVARWLAEAGFAVLDADGSVRDLYRSGEPGAAAVRELFGEEFLNAEGGVDAARLAGRVFANPQDRRALEAAIHPLVRQRFQDFAATATAPAVLEATLLVEAGYAPGFDRVVTVEADPEIRLRRAVARGLSEADARARLEAQGDGAIRRAAAHRVIDNSGDLADLRRQVDALIAGIPR